MRGVLGELATVMRVTKETQITSADPLTKVCVVIMREMNYFDLLFDDALKLHDFQDRCYNVRCGTHARCVDGVCQCEPGYEGDSSYECRPINQGVFPCMPLLNLSL